MMNYIFQIICVVVIAFCIEQIKKPIKRGKELWGIVNIILYFFAVLIYVSLLSALILKASLWLALFFWFKFDLQFWKLTIKYIAIYNFKNLLKWRLVTYF